MSKNVPTNKKLYARVKAEAKRKFDRWPSAYGSAWLVREYKKRGGGYKKAEMGMEVNDYGYGGMLYADQTYMYGGEDTDMEEYAKGGGIPQRYKNMGFTKVGVKKKSTRPGKKWMVLAKKGDKYKVVHGGFKGMKDFKQHRSTERKKRFWDRMGGKDSAKAKDPFSPLYWHKRFGTWEDGGEFEPHMMYDPETGEGFMANKMEDHLEMKEMGYLHKDEMKDMMKWGGQKYKTGGTNNAGFKALPPQVQQQILENMAEGGQLYQPVDIFNTDSMDFFKRGGQPCYSCGGQMKKYQFAGQPEEEDLFTDEDLAYAQQSLGYLPYPDDTGDLPLMYSNPFDNTIMLDEVTVTDTYTGLPDLQDNWDLNLEEVPEEIDNETFLNAAQLAEAKKKREADSKKSSEATGNPRLTAAMARIAGASALNQFMSNNAARKKEADMRMNLLTDNMAPLNVGSRGDYDINTGIFRPDDYVPVQFQSQFMSGGQTSMVDEETLKALIAAGADIELLD